LNDVFLSAIALDFPAGEPCRLTNGLRNPTDRSQGEVAAVNRSVFWARSIDISQCGLTPSSVYRNSKNDRLSAVLFART
jgi:hypothetical protein